MAQPTAMRLSETLRVESLADHDALEATVFARAATEGRLPIESYVGMLKALSVLHTVFERTMEVVTHSAVRHVWDPSLGRSAALAADLAHFGRFAFSEPRTAIEAALELSDDILRRSVGEPVSLVGDLYVLTGAAVGQASLAPIVAETFSLERAGVEYLRAFGDRTRQRCEQVKARIDGLELNDAERRHVRAAAHSVFRGFENIFRGLLPLQEQGPSTAVSLNPEAGRHRIPSDPREIGAAILAGQLSWEEFPYFEHRYGERGRRFTKSDSAWLVTLCDLAQPEVDDQVEWLTRVLASRGMPSFLMERHLLNLHERLVETIPTRSARYDRLLRASERIGEQRRAVLDDDRFEELAEAFDQTTRSLDVNTIPKVGRLVVSAVVDDRIGRARALESLMAWLADPQRFDAPWIEAVNAAVRTVEAEIELSGAVPGSY